MAERGQYRSIRITLFDGKDFRALPSDARWIFTLLKCNMGYAGIGVRYRDELTHRLVGQSGMSHPRVIDALHSLEDGDVQWVRWSDNVIWVVGQLEHDPHLKPENDKQRKGLLKYLAGLPRHWLVADFVEAHADWCRKGELKAMGMGWVYDRLSNAPTMPAEAKNRNKEKDKGKGVVEAGSGSDVWESDLITLCKAFPKLDTAMALPDFAMLRNLLERFHASTAGPQTKVIGEIAGALDGIHGECRTWPELRTNIGDFLINPEARPSMAALRGYLYRNPDTSARNGAKPTAGQRAFEAAGHALRGST